MPRVLVGRERELGVLDELVRGGDREVVVVTGEPGIGKTRILEEVARRVVAVGGTVAWGRMWEVGLTPAFWPWMQILGALETGDDRAPPLGSVDDRADAASRLGRFAEVAAYLGRRTAPIALLFDDVHAIDPSSLQLLEYVLPLLAGKHVVVALAARDGDASTDIATAIGRLLRGAHRLPLARLDRASVAALVGGRADGDRVFELSEGNPLFVEELVASLDTDGEPRLPQLSSVRAVIRERVARLPAPTREVVVAAAILGREFRGHLVADIVGAEDLGARILPVLVLGMVAMTSPDRYRFSHALIAEAIVDELDPSERARLHLRAAHAIERGDDDPSALAHHLLSAGHLAAEAAVHAAERAAKLAMTQLAFEDAAELLERALQALGLAAPADRRRRAELSCARAEALQQATQPAAATALCDEAAAIARELGDGELLARVALVRGLEFRFGRTDPLLVSALVEALAALGETGQPRLRARVLARLAAAEQPAADPMQPVARGFEAIELARTLEPRDRLEVMYVALAALVEYVEPARIDPIHHEVLELARGVDRWISVHTRLRLCFTALERIDRAGFEAAAAAFGAEARALGLPRWLHHVHLLAAMSALLDGRFADAEREAEDATAISVAMNDGNALWLLEVHRAMHAYIRTTPVADATRATLETYVRGHAMVRAWMAAQAGELEATRAALAEIGGVVPTAPDMAAMVATAIAFAGDAARAEAAYRTLATMRGRVVVAGMVGAAVMDLFDRQLLVLATVLERWDAIDGHAGDALEIAGRLASPVWAARVRADWADALVKRGRDGDAAKARELRARAFEDAERFGMPGLAARGRGNAPAKPRAPASGRVELARAGELWTLTGFGEQIHVKDSRGVQMIAKLVEEPGRELHVLELAGGGDPDGGGDAGPALDPKARAQYRTRLTELVADREQAEAWGDAGRLERANREIEALTAELERAVGLGGRDRKIGAASERARSNVQRRITHALDQIRAASPRLGEHLVASIRTGTYCVYSP